MIFQLSLSLSSNEEKGIESRKWKDFLFWGGKISSETKHLFPQLRTVQASKAITITMGMAWWIGERSFFLRTLQLLFFSAEQNCPEKGVKYNNRSYHELEKIDGKQISKTLRLDCSFVSRWSVWHFYVFPGRWSGRGSQRAGRIEENPETVQGEAENKCNRINRLERISHFFVLSPPHKRQFIILFGRGPFCLEMAQDVIAKGERKRRGILWSLTVAISQAI